MRSYDLTPLFRSTIGFDGLSRLIDTAMKMDDTTQGFPPYNIEKHGDDAYRITMAVAGFSENELNLIAQDNTLLVTGKKQESAEDTQPSFLYRGIAARAFERRFQLADHVRIVSASMKDGLLHIDLKREVPEAMRARTIPISTQSAPVIDGKKAH